MARGCHPLDCTDHARWTGLRQDRPRLGEGARPDTVPRGGVEAAARGHPVRVRHLRASLRGVGDRGRDCGSVVGVDDWSREVHCEAL